MRARQDPRWRDAIPDEIGVDFLFTASLGVGAPRRVLGVGRGFGLSGVVPLLSNWHEIRGEGKYLDMAQRSADTVLAVAAADSLGLYWTIPRFDFQGEGDATYTGYFCGSSCVGLPLVDVHYGAVGKEWRIRVPDDLFHYR